MIVVTDTTEVWVDPKDIRELFNGTEVGKIVAPTVYIEIDDDLGLEVVPTETIESKYGIKHIKDNSFTRSLREQFERNGRLSEKQINCLR